MYHKQIRLRQILPTRTASLFCRFPVVVPAVPAVALLELLTVRHAVAGLAGAWNRGDTLAAAMADIMLTLFGCFLLVIHNLVL